jgi:hypothetical protein
MQIVLLRSTYYTYVTIMSASMCIVSLSSSSCSSSAGSNAKLEIKRVFYYINAAEFPNDFGKDLYRCSVSMLINSYRKLQRNYYANH